MVVIRKKRQADGQLLITDRNYLKLKSASKTPHQNFEFCIIAEEFDVRFGNSDIKQKNSELVIFLYKDELKHIIGEILIQ